MAVISDRRSASRAVPSLLYLGLRRIFGLVVSGQRYPQCIEIIALRRWQNFSNSTFTDAPATLSVRLT
jgi:hypothetical protein